MLRSEETILIILFFYHIFLPLLVVVAQEEPVEPVVEGDEEERVVKVACHAHVLHVLLLVLHNIVVAENVRFSYTFHFSFCLIFEVNSWF